MENNMENNNIDLINKYVFNKTFNTLNEILLFLYNLEKYCHINNIRIDIDFWCEIVSLNSYIKDMISRIYSSFKYDDLESDFIKTLVNAYCVVENKDIYEKDNEYEYKESQLDNCSLKIDENYKKVLTKEEERELFIRKENGDKNAVEELIKYNIGFVKKIAIRYIKSGIELEDLFQEGTIGLIRAIEKFDYRRGHKFSTYSYWWIRQVITRYISDKKNSLKTSIHMEDEIYKIKNIMNKYGIYEPNSNDINKISKITGFSLRKIEDLVKLMKPIMSLSQTPPHKDESDNSQLIDTIKDPNIEDFDKSLIEKEMCDLVFDTDILTKKEKEVLKLRCGFYNYTEYSLEEIGKMYNITREAVRLIINRAIKKIRNKLVNLEAMTRVRKYSKNKNNLKE